MTDILLIDGNSVMFAMQHGVRRLHAGDLETTAIFGFLKTLRKTMITFPGASPMILWDSPKNWRKSVEPLYKAKRSTNKKMVMVKKAVVSQSAILRRLLTVLNVRQFEAEGFEADDIGGFLVHKFNKASKHVTMITGDRDWLQLVGPLCDWYEHRTEELVDEFAFTSKTGFETPTQFLQAKAMQGDTSDELPGVGGLGEGASIAIMGQFNKLSDMIKQWPEMEPTIKAGHPLSRYKNKITKFVNSVEAKQRLLMNMRLMSLLNVEIDNLVQVKGEYDERLFKAALGRLSFQSILLNYSVWISAFEGAE